MRATTCEAPLCMNLLPPPTKRGRPRQFCSDSCRERTNPHRCSVKDCPRPHRAHGFCNAHLKTEHPSYIRTADERRAEYEWTDARRDAYHRRRALMAESDERVNFATVCARDEWTCQICREPVDPDLVYPHPNSRSQDHRWPISRGGRHVFENVQLAHLHCNLDKRAKVDSALPSAS